MSTKKIDQKNIRKLTKVGGKSIAVTIPIDMLRTLNWREKQKVIVKLKDKKIIVQDWKK